MVVVLRDAFHVPCSMKRLSNEVSGEDPVDSPPLAVVGPQVDVPWICVSASTWATSG